MQDQKEYYVRHSEYLEWDPTQPPLFEANTAKFGEWTRTGSYKANIGGQTIDKQSTEQLTQQDSNSVRKDEGFTFLPTIQGNTE